MLRDHPSPLQPMHLMHPIQPMHLMQPMHSMQPMHRMHRRRCCRPRPCCHPPLSEHSRYSLRRGRREAGAIRGLCGLIVTLAAPQARSAPCVSFFVFQVDPCGFWPGVSVGDMHMTVTFIASGKLGYFHWCCSPCPNPDLCYFCVTSLCWQV